MYSFVLAIKYKYAYHIGTLKVFCYQGTVKDGQLRVNFHHN